VLAAGEADVRSDGVVVAVGGDVGEEQPGNAFAAPPAVPRYSVYESGTSGY